MPFVASVRLRVKAFLEGKAVGVPALLAGAAVVGFAVACLGTAPAVGMGINWDTASYVAALASRQSDWSADPWSSHYALGPAYLLGAWSVQPVGGTFIDGARFLNALCVAISCGLVAYMTAALSGSKLVAGLLTAAFITSWGSLVLVFTLEDNLLFTPWALAAVAVAIRRVGAWRLRDGLLAGALVGAGTLMSWQAAAYAFPPVYVAVALGGRGRAPWLRARDGLAVVAAVAATRTVWTMVFWITASGQRLGHLLSLAFARPTPSFFPDDLDGWGALLPRWPTLLRHVGTGLLAELGPAARDSLSMRRLAFSLGTAVMLIAVVVVLASLIHGARRGRWRPHLVGATLLALLVTAACYVDLPIDKFKRYDFLPTLFILLAAAVVGEIGPHTSRRLRIGAATSVAALVVVQAVVAVRWNRDFHARLSGMTPTSYHGPDGETWFAFMRRVRRQAPGACHHVFALDELAHGRFQREIPAALWSELPAPLVLGEPSEMATWQRPLPMLPLAAQGQLTGCEWLSPGARRLLGRP